MIKVKISLTETSQVIEHDAKNTYTKGPFYCVYDKDGTVYKYPVANIWRAAEGYGDSGRALIPQDAHPNVGAVTDTDRHALLDMASLFDELATNAYPHPLAFAQICMRLHERLSGSARNAAIEDCAKWVNNRCRDYIKEHGSYDRSTGMTEYPGDGEQYVFELEEIAEGLRALAKGDPQ